MRAIELAALRTAAKCLTPRDFSVWALLLTMADESGNVATCYDAVAAEARCDKGTARRSLKSLADAGAVLDLGSNGRGRAYAVQRPINAAVIIGPSEYAPAPTLPPPPDPPPGERPRPLWARIDPQTAQPRPLRLGAAVDSPPPHSPPAGIHFQNHHHQTPPPQPGSGGAAAGGVGSESGTGEAGEARHALVSAGIFRRLAREAVDRLGPADAMRVLRQWRAKGDAVRPALLASMLRDAMDPQALADREAAQRAADAKRARAAAPGAAITDATIDAARQEQDAMAARVQALPDDEFDRLAADALADPSLSKFIRSNLERTRNRARSDRLWIGTIGAMLNAPGRS